MKPGRLGAFLASFRLRLLLRGAFLLLTLAVLALAVVLLQEEKQRSYDHYQESLNKTRAQIIARLHHPAGQLALLNPPRPDAAPMHPVRLPFAAIDFDDQNKAHHAVEMAGCLIRYPGERSLCAGVGNSPWAGGFLYAAGSFPAPLLTPHRLGDEVLENATRLMVSVESPGSNEAWIAPFELPAVPGSASQPLRGRFTGYVPRRAEGDAPANYKGALPVKEFRGWVWQNAECLDPVAEAARQAALAAPARGAETPVNAPPPGPLAGEASAATSPPPALSTGNEAPLAAPASVPAGAGVLPADAGCLRRTFFSLRVPVEALKRAATAGGKSAWPPDDLAQFQLRVLVLPPGRGEALLDSAAAGAEPPFTLSDLGALLLPGERLSLYREGQAEALVALEGRDKDLAPAAPWLLRLIGHLPVDHFDAPVRLEESLETGAGRFLLQLQGDARSVNRSLAVAASRASAYLAAMLAAIALAWLVIEIGLIRRIARLTKRTRGLSRSVHEAGDLARYELGDLRGRDELGLLAGALSDLLRRVREDADRESLRAAQEKEQWHAVGHEIMSPLQSLLALHGQPDDPSYRYISRMQQAIRVLYGSASPSEAISASRLQIQRVDLAAFLRHVAENAGIDDLRWDFGPWADPAHGPLWVRADEFPLEDVFAHLLNNAERYRLPGTPIRLDLRVDATSVSLTLHNQGPGLAPGMADKIFEYGVSDAAPEEAGPRAGGRGQGLFVARTYLSKMGGSIRAENLDGGVSFIIGLQRSAGD